MSDKKYYSAEPITPITPKHRWRILSDDELAKMKEATYRILEDIGIQFPLRRALDLFAEHGAEVDFEEQMVRMAPDLVDRALSNAPRYFDLGGRLPAYDLSLQKNCTYFGTDGCHPFFMDLETREKRHGRKEDLAVMARMADYLDPIAFGWPMVSATDHGKTAPMHELHAWYLNSRKHVQLTAGVDETLARYACEIASIVAGDPQRMAEKPPLSALICTIDPLAQDRDALEAALVFAEQGVPVGFMAMNTLMSTGPAAMAGSLAVGNAEVIAGLVMVQLAFPGAPVFHSIMPAVMEPRTAGYLFQSPLGDAMFGAAVELSHDFNIPSLGCFGGTDAKEPSWRAAKEKYSGFISALVGAEFVLGVGDMESATTTFPENLILDCDLLHDFRITCAGIEVNEKTLALDTVKKVGPRGVYLMEDHTLDNIRQIPFSDLIMETSKKGRVGPEAELETAMEIAREIIESHWPEPLDEARQAELERVVAAADREIKGG